MTAKGTTFTAELPDGEIAARTSKTMSYLFAIAVDRHTDRTVAALRNGWGVWGWSQSLTGAEKAAKEARKCYADVRIIPAVTS